MRTMNKSTAVHGIYSTNRINHHGVRFVNPIRENPMSRIPATDLDVVPNFARVLANSPKALEGFLGLQAARVDIDFPKIALLDAPARRAA